MTKQEALKQIEELKKYVEDLEKPKALLWKPKEWCVFTCLLSTGAWRD